MNKSLSDALAELGYIHGKTSPSINKRTIFKDGKAVGQMSYEETWGFLKREHPEYFKEVD